MIFKYLILLSALHLIVTDVHSTQDKESNQLETIVPLMNHQEIDDSLVATEEMRTTNFQEFTSNLESLVSSEKKFTFDQKCFYDFLYSYKQTYIGEFEQALTRLLSLSKTCKDIKVLVRINALLSNLYVISGDYQKAFFHLDPIISAIDKINDKKTKHIAYTVSFLVYEIADQWQLSLKFAELLINDSPTEEFLCKGNIYKYISKLKLNIKTNFEKEIFSTIKSCNKIGETAYAQALNMGLVKKQLEIGKTKEELELILNRLLDANDEIENTQYKNLIGIKNSLFAIVHERLDNPELAIKYANRTIQDSVSIGTTEQKIEALQVLINHYQKILDYKAANQYLLEKNKAEIKLYTDTQAKLMAYQTVKHDSLAKTLQITSLNQRNDLLSLENKLAEESKNSQRLINILLGTLLLFFLFLIYRIRKQQKQYKKLSEFDHMTLVYNRKGARDYMDYLLPYSENKNELISYCIFDLDKFKKVNDNYGHPTGDWVIKTVISVCQDLSNAKATFARLGGEEFSVTIRDSSLKEIKEFSEQCRLAIYAIKTLAETGHDFQISASFGITTTEISGYDYLKLMKHADIALYASKHNGRNQISVFEKALHNPL